MTEDRAHAYALEFERPLLELEERVSELRQLARSGAQGLEPEIERLERKAEKLQQEIFSDLSRWQIVQLSRHAARPYTLDYVERLFTDFLELHGDRAFSDDRSIVAGFARLDGEPVLVVGHQKGRSTKENVARNFGMPRPEGYRKAMRLMRLAERFSRPVLTFIDTPGAYPGIGAEERGQAQAIAESLEQMSALRVPIIATVTGEGGSGGALALGVANRVLMLEHAIYSVISPEGASSILFKDASRADKMAEAMRVTARDLGEAGVIDEIVHESPGGAHRDPAQTAENLGRALRRHLAELKQLSPEELVEDRRRRFRRLGAFAEANAAQ